MQDEIRLPVSREEAVMVVRDGLNGDARAVFQAMLDGSMREYRMNLGGFNTVVFEFKEE